MTMSIRKVMVILRDDDDDDDDDDFLPGRPGGLPEGLKHFATKSSI